MVPPAPHRSHLGLLASAGTLRRTLGGPAGADGTRLTGTAPPATWAWDV